VPAVDPSFLFTDPYVTTRSRKSAWPPALGGAFYLHGEDEFRKEKALKELVDAHLDPATADFNYDLLRGREVEPETLASILATPPMMAEYRVVVLREVEGLATSARAREVLLGAVKNPPPGLALVLSATVPQGSKAKLYDELRRQCESVEFQSLAPEDVPGWLMERTREVHGVEMDVDAAQALGAAVGVSLGILEQELEKLAGFAGEGATITLEHVRAAGTHLPSQDRWAWFDMVGERRFREALNALPVLMGQGESGVGLVVGLANHLLRLGLVVEGGTPALEASLPPRQKWLARRLAAQGSRWPGAEVRGALEGLLRVDRLLKSGGPREEHLLEEWLLVLLARKEAA